MLDLPSFARQYSPQAFDDAFELVRDYYTVMGYHADRPSLGYVSLGKRLDVPKYRINSWINEDRTPPVVDGIEVAESWGWFDTRADWETGRSLWLLTVASNACGSIPDAFRPTWYPETVESESAIRDALEAVGTGATDAKDEGAAVAELTPSEEPQVLGRALVTLGAPRGWKSEEAVPPLPDALLDGPDRARFECARLYVRERSANDDRPSVTLPLNKRTDAFVESVVQLLRSVTDAEISIGSGVTVSADAADDLDLH